MNSRNDLNARASVIKAKKAALHKMELLFMADLLTDTKFLDECAVTFKVSALHVLKKLSAGTNNL